MSFTVAGSLDGTLYEVEVTGDPARPVVGSKRVKGLVRQFEGETVLATPVGPAYVVKPGDEASILALLCDRTKVMQVGTMGQTVPALVDDPQDAVIR